MPKTEQIKEVQEPQTASIIDYTAEKTKLIEKLLTTDDTKVFEVKDIEVKADGKASKISKTFSVQDFKYLLILGFFTDEAGANSYYLSDEQQVQLITHFIK